jgi:hypothetical protein
MSSFLRSRLWLWSRRLFRWFRIGVLLTILFTLCFLFHLSQTGLPDFLKRPLLEELGSHGVILEFSRLRWHWQHGILAENVRLSRTETLKGITLFADQVELKLKLAALKKWRLELEALRIRQGRLTWRIEVPESPDEWLNVDHVQATLRLLPDDQWQLDRFQASCLGANFRVLGDLTNVSYRPRPSPGPPDRPAKRVNEAAWNNIARQVIATVQRLSFTHPPEFLLVLHVDARDIAQSRARLGIQMAQARSPWGELNELRFNAVFSQPSGSNGVVEAAVSLSVNQALSSQVQVSQLNVNGRLQQVFTNALPVFAQMRITAASVQSPWGTGANLDLSGEAMPAQDRAAMRFDHLEGHVESVRTPQLALARASFAARAWHPATNWTPESAQVKLELEAPSNRWGTAQSAILTLNASASSGGAKGSESWGFWAGLAPYTIEGTLGARHLQATNLAIAELDLAGSWQAPRLVIERIQSELYGGALTGSGELNVDSRVLQAKLDTSFDLQSIGPWLRPNSQRWLRQYEWRQPPQATAIAQVTLPPWNQARTDWREEVLPTLNLNGHLRVAHGAFRTIPFECATSHVQFSNLVWFLPDLQILRPEGILNLVYWNDTRTQDYRFDVLSQIDPHAIAPMLDDNERQVLGQFDTPMPPRIEGTLWGRWRAPDRTGFEAHIRATNLAFRGETTTALQAKLAFTNQTLEAREIRLERDTEFIECPEIVYDGHQKLLTLSNASCYIDPLVVTRAIGAKTAEAIKPYRFHQTPRIQVDGTIPVRDAARPDLHFEVAGGPFSFSKFNLDPIQASLHWQKDSLVLTNVQAGFYHGQLKGDAAFDFSADRGAQFHFQARVSNMDLHPLMADLRSKTNHLEGTITGRLDIRQANTADWQSWNGSGEARLRSGLLWEIPLFGLFSPLLNSIYPGLGNNKASEGTATFALTNSVIHTRDLELRAPPVRLRYEGTIDFDGNVQARIEALLLRDTWLLGRIFSLALYPITKIFEYRITGTLTQPKSDPLYLLPRLLLMPLRPVRLIKDLFNSDPEKNPAPPPNRSAPRP